MRCPLRTNCSLFVNNPAGEEHSYKVYEYKIGWRGDISCKFHDPIEVENEPTPERITIFSQVMEYIGDDSEIRVADGLEDACIGYDARENRVVYSYTKVLEILMARDGMTEEQAVEFFDFNIGCAYVGPNTPIFVIDNFQS